ncbi:MAG: hypothetical protein H6728_12550 [Myxococcales bacterium]|nr:hypothetical protein [Myxococcales bacterium]MCB9643897.1 hypothetical protein [Myxococcales bacterium]
MTNDPTSPQERPELEDAPPILGSWKRIYILVLSVLAVQLALYAWLSWNFAP